MTDYLVTGGAGFIGGALVERLVEDDHDVCVLDNFSRGVPERLENIEDDIQIVEADVRDPDQLREPCLQAESILHLAAVNGTENFYEKPDQVLEVGLKGTLNVMDFAVQGRCSQFLMASSSEVYHEPDTVPTDETEPLRIPDISNPRFSYSSTKIIGESLTFHYLPDDIQRLMIRPHNVYGPSMGFEHVIPDFVEKAVQLDEEHDSQETVSFPIQGDGEQTRAFCHIDDAVEGIITVLENGDDQEIYNIGTENEVTIGELAHKVAEIFGLEIIIEREDVPDGSTSRRCPDISKIRELGFEPEVTLDAGLEETLSWYEQYFRENDFSGV
ncbi:MAG: NAD-dependent epimerase/dehydratase family protein [bacterium]